MTEIEINFFLKVGLIIYQKLVLQITWVFSENNKWLPLTFLQKLCYKQAKLID